MILDTRSSRVVVDGNAVKLTSHEYRLLSYLMHHQGRVVSRTELVEHLYDQDFDRDSNTIEVFRRAAPQEARRRRDPDGSRPRLSGGSAGAREGALKVAAGSFGARVSRAWPGGGGRCRSRRASFCPPSGSAPSSCWRPGIILSTLYKRNSELGFDERLNVYLKALVADVASFGESDRSEPGNLGEPRFELPLSGWYWQISRIDTERDSEQAIRTSKSLFASRLPRLTDQQASRRPNGIVEGYVEGPDRQTLRVVERLIDLGDDGRYLVAVAGDPSEIVAGDAAVQPDAARDLRRLGLALAAVTLAQVRFGLRPLVNLQGALGQIRRGEATRIEGSFPPEVAPLAEELNLLVDSNHEVIERARTHVGNLAHALKTPISVILNEAGGDESALAEKVREQTQVMRDQVNYYLDRARAAAARRRWDR